MNYLLILWAFSHAPMTIPAMERFETKEQCETVKKYITEKHGYYMDSECLYIGKGTSK